MHYCRNFSTTKLIRWFYLILSTFVLLINSIFGAETQPAQLCPEHFTCLSSDRTLDNLQFLKLNSSVPNWYELCNCDSYCHVFGDCCSDAPVIADLRFEDWSFVKVRLSSKITFMSLMKSKCSRQWKGSAALRAKCEVNPLHRMYDYLLPDVEHLLLLKRDEEFANWHVTSSESLITYRNVYCAACNDDHKVEAWTQRLRCIPEESTDLTTEQSGVDTCTTVFYQTSPESLGKEKLKRTPLQNKVYSTCNLGWYKINVAKNTTAVLDIVKRCLVFYEPVVVQDPRSHKYIVFKNKYCALCNQFDESTHQCSSVAVDHLTQVPASFNLITTFDANYQHGSVINEERNQTCQADHVYNPLTSACQLVIFPLEPPPSTRPPSSSNNALNALKQNKNLRNVTSSGSSIQVIAATTTVHLLLLQTLCGMSLGLIYTITF